MTTKQIEALVESVENKMNDELGEYPRIEVLGYESGDYDVQFSWEGYGVEHSEIVANDLTDDELEYFLENDVDAWLREFYYRMKNGGVSLYHQAHIQLAAWILANDLMPSEVYVDIRWKEDGDRQENQCICCSKQVYEEQHADDFNPDAPLSNGKMDDAYLFYCDGVKEFFKLLYVKNGEDFEITEIRGWD